ncbi:MAG TPA: hypothetical protein VN732_04570 [Solirubrobacterales bacterium]|nr:hypothetical protein [Solirubrobacterales bacterium]
MHRLLTASITITAVALFAPGCGSSMEDGTVPTLTKAEFVKQAEEVCTEATKERRAAAAAWQKEHPGNLNQDDLDAAFREVIGPSIAEQVKALEAIPAPRADKAMVVGMVENLAKTAEDIVEKGTAGAQGQAISTYLREAEKYGLRDCTRLS